MTFAAALTLVLVVSCGSSEKKAAPAASPVSLAIATTAAPTTAAPSTTLPVPTSPPTTAVPTTTTISQQDLEKVVRQAHDEYWVAKFRCTSVPASCDPTSFTPSGSAVRTNVTRSIAALIEKKWAIRQNDGDPATTVVESIVFNEARTVATLKECLWDSAMTLQPNAGPNGEDIIVDDSKSSFENTVTMVLSDRTWLVSDRTEVSKHEGVNECAGR